MFRLRHETDGSGVDGFVVSVCRKQRDLWVLATRFVEVGFVVRVIMHRLTARERLRYNAQVAEEVER